MLRPMREGVCRKSATQRPHNRVMRNLPQTQDYAKMCHRRDFSLEKPPACGHFLRLGLVLRRNAAHRVRNPAIVQNQPVLGARAVNPSGKTRFQKSSVEQNPGIIPRKRPPGKIRAFEARRKADNQKPGIKRPKRRNRRIVTTRKFPAVILPKRRQTRTQGTGKVRRTKRRCLHKRSVSPFQNFPKWFWCGVSVSRFSGKTLAAQKRLRICVPSPKPAVEDSGMLAAAL